ncbi:hypothetical protein CkaCkLH20_03892 [Colletotrichum karsti]|uniref:Amine oxidase domain-containing protein n=1 Tax=Colletotrichum karsti TaxID=1095194 RepID=A0A9P6LMH1_9PEZI|nr:uncharacterized protein CkaCkLH20_03892 [Colletotrichum karsti]KAF9878400.1 hypothetical protein CkaCkLH20_03892 [Colletotrichum karsti]
MGHEAPLRVAVVGTGLAGLTTAYLLQNDERQRYAVTLFEQAESLSFDSASVAVRDERSGDVERIDLPMRALAGGYYQNVMGMYDHLGIPYHPVRFLFSFVKALPPRKHDPTVGKTGGGNLEGAGGVPGEYFVHASNLHQIPPWPGSRGMVSHFVEILYLIVCQFWFTVACFLVRPITEGCDRAESLAEYLERIWLPRRYVTHYLLPLISSVSTCSHAELLAFPASDVVIYKKMSHGQQHYTVCGGVHQVESRLARGMRDVRLGARVVEVASTTSGKVRITWQSTRDGNGSVLEDEFDRVILAVSPDVAGKIFKPLSKTLGKIPTIRVESSILRPASTAASDVFSVTEDVGDGPKTCAHHKGSTMPSQAICLRTDFGKEARTEALHTMPGGTVVSTCSLNPAAEAKRVLRTARFTRTLRTVESRAVIQAIMKSDGKTDKKTEADDGAAWVNGEDNVWLTGAWCWDGMVLLEGCLISAMRIADDFGVQQQPLSTVTTWIKSFDLKTHVLTVSAGGAGDVCPTMRSLFTLQSDFLLGALSGVLFFVFITLILATLFLRKNDIYNADHWKLNVKVPFTTTMWMNLGYWSSHDGQPIRDFEQACRGLLQEVVASSGILNNITSSKLAILDLGIGCGDQSLELARLLRQSEWKGYRYVGLTLNETQLRIASSKMLHGLQSDKEREAVQVFQADAAKPESWAPDTKAAVESLTRDRRESYETWVLGLDSLYHFFPSRRPIFKYAAASLDANLMAFDLLLSETASFTERLVVKLISLGMKCPINTFVTEEAYTRQLREAGYDEKQTQFRDVTDHVFSGLVRHINEQENFLKPYGISIAKYKVAGKLFVWFARSKALRATIVVARKKPKAT